MGRQERGFTIIEVILFLAISGLLLAVAIAAINTNINNSRFNDAIRSTTSYIQGQYNEVASGQSDRDASKSCDSSGNITNVPSSLGMGNCVIMGRYIKLQGSTFTVRYITGYRSSLVGVSTDDTKSVNDMEPQVASVNAYQSQYNVPWGISLANTTGLAIVRSPGSGSVLFYIADNESSDAPVLKNVIIVDGNLNKDATLCFEDSGSSRVGRINIKNGQGQEVIQTDLATIGACS